MINDLSLLIVFGGHKPCPCKTANFIENCCVCADCSADQPPRRPQPPPLPLPSGLRHDKIEMKPINNPTVASPRSGARKIYMSLTSNQKLEVVKPSEEGTWKAGPGRKPGPLCPLAKPRVQRKSPRRRRKALLHRTHE